MALLTAALLDVFKVQRSRRRSRSNRKSDRAISAVKRKWAALDRAIRALERLAKIQEDGKLRCKRELAHPPTAVLPELTARLRAGDASAGAEIRRTLRNGISLILSRNLPADIAAAKTTDVLEAAIDAIRTGPAVDAASILGVVLRIVRQHAGSATLAGPRRPESVG
jgi:hypothetical protein